MAGGTGSMVLSDYCEQIKDTDILSSTDINPVLQGLYGEVGGIMSAAKKAIREKNSFPGFKAAAEEEFGDTLWYVAALCRRLNLSLVEVFDEAVRDIRFKSANVASDLIGGGFSHVIVPTSSGSDDVTLFKLGKSAAALLESSIPRHAVVNFAADYLEALHVTNLAFSDVVRRNLRKARGAFVLPSLSELPDFDIDFPEEEQLPREFRIRFCPRNNGKSYMQWQGVFIGDPLTDNIADPDAYRFHDVFHLAYVAILHWSPVVRALIKHKRKSDPNCDEAQDSGRAIVVEEGLTAWIFSRAKDLLFFKDQDRVSFGILKTIEGFVAGYEVDKCPLKLWEKAILDGYGVFRQIRDANGGWVIGNRAERTIEYAPLE